MRYRLSVEDRWIVMHQVVHELAMRFPPAVHWTPDLITASEFDRVERWLATLIAQRLDHMNEANPDAVDSEEEDPPWSLKMLVSRNLPPARSYQSDVREMEETHAALLKNQPLAAASSWGKRA